LRQLIDNRERAMLLSMTTHLRTLNRRLQDCDQRLAPHHPAATLLRLRDRLAADQRRLTAAAAFTLRAAQLRLSRLALALSERHPRHAADLGRQKLDLLTARLHLSMQTDHQRRAQALESLSRQLSALGPEQVLRRGYSITTLRKHGTLIRRASQVKPGDRLLTRFAEGEIESTAEDPNQPSLFE
jgi:exodeoxyribonuclease VII large subunit